MIPLSGNSDHKNGPTDIILSAQVFAGQLITLPVPYTHGLHKIESSGRNYQTQQDQNGDLVIFVDGSGKVELKVILAPYPDKKFKSNPETVRVPTIPSEFSEETNKKLKEIKDKKRGNIARAHALFSLIFLNISL